MTTRSVPPTFAELQPFVAQWALRSEEERYALLHAVTMAQLRQFYDIMMSRLPEVLEYLNGFPLDELPDDAQTLFDLAMTLAHTAHPIDLKWKDTDFKGACDWRKMGFASMSRSEARATEEDADPFAMD
jgi:hypothetical protein